MKPEQGPQDCITPPTKGALLKFDLSEAARDLIISLPKCKIRKKRKPSIYNKFIKACIPAKKGDIPGRMKACAKEYKEDKAKGKWRYEGIQEGKST